MILEKRQRIVSIENFTYQSEIISSDKLIPETQQGLLKDYKFYATQQIDDNSVDDEPFYYFSVLLNNDRSPWYEANLFLLHIANSPEFVYTAAKIARKASQLLDYKLWCEQNNINMFDFTARRPKNRPTYCYFSHLHESGISAGNLNQRTSLIYKFTRYFSEQYQIDTNRIDQVTNAFIHLKNKQGYSITLKVNKRKLTKSVPKFSKHVMGKVIDEGEYLRPLIKSEQELLINALKNPRYKNDERLIFNIAIDTGARKQTILTLRLKHIKLFTTNNLSSDGSYKIPAGPGTGIDTKFNKILTISIPESLGEKLKMYAFSKVAQQRREIFTKKFGDIFKYKDDIYLFLSSRGDCRYMAKSDPRFTKTKIPPTGGSIQTIVKKLFTFDLPDTFPKDYTFHWNRASYAFNYYLFLKPLVDNNKISHQDLIAFIQHALSHEHPETTEKYLNLFTDHKKLYEMQSQWENKFFNRSIFDTYSNRII